MPRGAAGDNDAGACLFRIVSRAALKSVILRCALLRASKDDGPSVADSSFEARCARTSGWRGQCCSLARILDTVSHSRGAIRPRFASRL